MDDLIKKHNFEKAKQNIKSFAENLPDNPRLKRVSEDAGPFGWLDHDVSGKELNELASQIQDCLVSNNQNIRKTIQEFRVIYETLEYLDKDYLAGIVASVQAAEAASEAANKNTEKLDVAQQDIKKNLDGLKKLVEKLKDFKLKSEKDFNTLRDLTDSLKKNISAQKNDIDNIRIRVKDLNDSLNRVDKRFSEARLEINNSLNVMEKRFIQCNGFIEKLRKQKHLHEIDLLWQSNQDLQSKLVDFNNVFLLFQGKSTESLNDISQEMNTLSGFKEKLEALVHLTDVDELWKLHHVLSEQLDLALNDQVALIESSEKKYKHRLYLSYGIAIVAVAISVCNFFV